MILKKIFLLLVLIYPLQSNCGTPFSNVHVRKCSTLLLRDNSFFGSLEEVSRPGAKGDEQDILTRLCSSSAMPWKIIQLGAQRAAPYPREVKSQVFSDSSDFAQAIAACITDEGISTQKLESRFRPSIFTKFLWGAAGALVGFSCALAYMKYMNMPTAA